MTPARTSARRGLRIFSANLLLGRTDPSSLAALLRELDADVAAFQELASQHVEAIAAVLPHGDLQLGGGPKMGLALRHPAEIRPIVLLGRDAHAGVLRPECWPGLEAPLEILTAHITPPHHRPPWRTFSRRRAQVRGLVAHITASPEIARVVVGDLNATPLWPAYRRLTARLQDAALIVAGRTGRAPARTWSPWTRGPRLLRLDHALVRGVRVHDFRVVGVRGSDHAGILVEVSPGRAPRDESL